MCWRRLLLFGKRAEMNHTECRCGWRGLHIAALLDHNEEAHERYPEVVRHAYAVSHWASPSTVHWLVTTGKPVPGLYLR